TALGSTKFLELPVLSFKTETLRKSVGCITYARNARPYIPALDDASMKQSRSVPLHMAVASPVSEPRPAGAGAVFPVPNTAASTARARARLISETTALPTKPCESPSTSFENTRMTLSLRGVMVCSAYRSEEHTSELQSRENLVCRLLLEKKKIQGCGKNTSTPTIK